MQSGQHCTFLEDLDQGSFAKTSEQNLGKRSQVEQDLDLQIGQEPIVLGDLAEKRTN